MVVWTTRAFLVGLMGHSLLEMAARAFYAQQNARTPMAASFMGLTVFVILAVSLSYLLGVAGIGLANALAFTSEALLLLWLLSRRYSGLFEVKNTLLRAVPSGGGAAVLVYFLMKLPLPILPLTIVSLALGGLVVLPFIWPEVKLLIKL
jgi:putative peptidoglycan lipid II flippase